MVLKAIDAALGHPLRDALRAWRSDGGPDSNPDAPSLFGYFARFGDDTDLAWMEKALAGMAERDRPLGRQKVQELRDRLATN